MVTNAGGICRKGWSMKLFIKNLASCRARIEKTNEYERYAEANGHTIVKSPREADSILVWTCGFRDDFKLSSVDKINEYLEKTSASIILAGCLNDIDRSVLPAESDRVRFVQWKNDEVDLACTLGGELSLNTFRRPLAQRKLCDNAAQHRALNPESTAMFADQFNILIISSGCRYSCAYCSEKLVFPDYQSHSPESLVQAARELYAANGVKEFCLMADSVGQYGIDMDYTLPRLIDLLRKVVGDLSFALNNLNPSCVLGDMDNYMRLIREGAIIHLNLPLQSASDAMLEAMQRGYRKADIEYLYSRLEEEGFTAHDTHLLSGFPGESEYDIETTIDFFFRHRPRYVLLSRFMPCKGTIADSLPRKIPIDVATARIKKIVQQLEAMGIICNFDDSEISKTRRSRLSKDP